MYDGGRVRRRINRSILFGAVEILNEIGTDMLSKELEASLNKAFSDAREKRHEYITVEHLLLALLDNNSANVVLHACGADIKANIWTIIPLFLVTLLGVKCSQHSVFNVFCNVRFFMYSPPEKKRWSVRMYWLPSLVSRNHRRYIF